MKKIRIYLIMLSLGPSHVQAEILMDEFERACKHLNQCVIQTTQLPDFSSEMRSIFESVPWGACNELRPAIAAMKSTDAIYQPALRCYSTLAKTDCKTLQNEEGGIPACKKFLNAIETHIPQHVVDAISPKPQALSLMPEKKTDIEIKIRASNHGWNYVYNTHDVNGSNKSEIVLPTKTAVRLVIDSTDIIHTLHVPDLGITIGAIPGYLNRRLIEIETPARYHGYCSKHKTGKQAESIIINAVTPDAYDQWKRTRKE